MPANDTVKAAIQRANEPCACRRIGKQANRCSHSPLLLPYLSFLASSEAARECRRKKKEYIKCLEERVMGLENQNKALIEELRQLKELYCQREETSGPTNNSSKLTATR